VPSLFKQHNYKHESLESTQIDEIMASGNATAIKVALYALTLEGVLHQIADHNPPKGMERGEWAQKYADWAICPDLRDPPPPNEF
jgi:hypothetical protein